ncbi:unnamed protein product [Toxocara canis]|uniref:Uncharacterized protein n=1 Tax=Toxocara canis TaxID=6265 RepID=A0A183VB55_TOXCA|nr:unnamed protein product [Toxocara canis]
MESKEAPGIMRNEKRMSPKREILERQGYIKHLYECSLRNSEHNLHSVRAGCATPLETSMYATSASRGRQSSEPKQHMSGSKDNGKEVKRNQEEQTSGNTERSEWESWMRSQPLSVLKLDRTERLVLRIGG